MSPALLLLAIASATNPAPAPDASETPPPRSGTIVLRRCSLQFERTAALGSAQMGVRQDCLVQPGDRVKTGQVLGRLMDQDLRAELEQRQAEANNDTAVRACQAKYAQTLSRFRATDTLSR